MKVPVDIEYAVAPFTDGQVDQINSYQRAGLFHVLRCPTHPDKPLEASSAGLSCAECSYLQKSCPEYIASGRWSQYVRQTREQHDPSKP